MKKLERIFTRPRDRSFLFFTFEPGFLYLNQVFKNFRPTQFVIPDMTVDGTTFYTNLEDLGQLHWGWGGEYDNHRFKEDLQRIFSQACKKNCSEVDEFPFQEARSFVASKSFMSWHSNVLYYQDVYTWASNMYEADNLSFSTDRDFQKNCSYLLNFEGMTRKIISVDYYSWHDRCVWCNSGGSHHAAALVRQIIDQNREFFIRANVTEYSINPTSILSLKNHAYLYIVPKTFEDINSGEQHNNFLLFLNKLKIPFVAADFPCRQKRLSILAIKKSWINSKFSEKVFINWMNVNITESRAMNFYDFILNPKKYLDQGHYIY